MSCSIPVSVVNIGKWERYSQIDTNLKGLRPQHVELSVLNGPSIILTQHGKLQTLLWKSMGCMFSLVWNQKPKSDRINTDSTWSCPEGLHGLRKKLQNWSAKPPDMSEGADYKSLDLMLQFRTWNVSKEWRIHVWYRFLFNRLKVPVLTFPLHADHVAQTCRELTSFPMICTQKPISWFLHK